MKSIVSLVLWIRNLSPRIYTYHIENTVVFVILAVIAIISGKGLIEWIGVFAVFATFNHVSVASRLEEAEAARHEKKESVMVDCYKKLTVYFYLKEMLWFAYFIILGAWSAVAGVIVFLLYPLWRKSWLKYSMRSDL